MWTEFVQGPVAGVCERGNRPLGFHKLRWISWLTERPLNFQDEISFMKEICQNLYLRAKIDVECKNDQNENNYVILHSLHKIK
jgi:hypothetical protein